jgi:hypothetical protein
MQTLARRYRQGGAGWLTFVQQNAFLARRFDATRGQLSGDPVTPAQAVGVSGTTQAGAFSVPVPVWLPREREPEPAGNWSGSIARGNAPERWDLPTLPVCLLQSLRPIGWRVAVSRSGIGTRDIWLTDGDCSTRFTFDPAADLGIEKLRTD